MTWWSCNPVHGVSGNNSNNGSNDNDSNIIDINSDNYTYCNIDSNSRGGSSNPDKLSMEIKLLII